MDSGHRTDFYQACDFDVHEWLLLSRSTQYLYCDYEGQSTTIHDRRTECLTTVLLLSMEFQPISTNDLWLDFTIQTPIEAIITSIEQVLIHLTTQPCDDKIVEIRGQSFSFHFVSKDPHEAVQLPSRLELPPDAPAVISRLFAITSSFVIVTRIHNFMSLNMSNQIEFLFSVLFPAILSSEFPFPVFVQIGNTVDYTFRGINYHNSIHSLFSSEWNRASTPPEEVASVFRQSLSIRDNLSLLTRQEFIIKGYDFHSSTRFFTHTDFMVRCDRDPVYRFRVLTEFPNCPIGDSFNPISAPSLHLSVRFNEIERPPPRLRAFIESFNPQLGARTFAEVAGDTPDRIATSAITELFERTPFDLRPERTVLKAAPKDSLLLNLTVLLITSESLTHFASLWLEFIGEVERRASAKHLLPGVGTCDPQFEHCILFQKLQMLNVCSRGALPPPPAPAPGPAKRLLSGAPMVVPAALSVVVRTEDQVHAMNAMLENSGDDVHQKVFQDWKHRCHCGDHLAPSAKCRCIECSDPPHECSDCPKLGDHCVLEVSINPTAVFLCRGRERHFRCKSQDFIPSESMPLFVTCSYSR
jgi:hypothetical protein